MLLAPVIVILISIDFVFKGDGARGFASAFTQKFFNSSVTLPCLGFLTCSSSVLIGLGGGFFLIPSLIYFRGLEIKKSNFYFFNDYAVECFPRLVVSFLVGRVKLAGALGLLFSVLPGSFLASKMVLKLNFRLLDKLLVFGFFLLFIGIVFLAIELGVK